MLGALKRKLFGEAGRKNDEVEVLQTKKAGLEKKRPAVQEAVRVAKGTEIRYDTSLIDKLKGDHQDLLGLFTDISDSADNGNFDECNHKLGRFKFQLTDHLLNENVKLYVFLDRQMEDDDLNSELIKGFRREMDQIGKVVMDFFRRYQSKGVSASNVAEFQQELSNIGQVLVDRINREESTLYPLYEQI